MVYSVKSATIFTDESVSWTDYLVNKLKIIHVEINQVVRPLHYFGVPLISGIKINIGPKITLGLKTDIRSKIYKAQNCNKALYQFWALC